MTYKVYLCGDEGTCPHDGAFEHRFYFGCVPKNFRERAGTSKTHRQHETRGHWFWNGGCDAHHREAEWVGAQAGI